MGANEAAGRRTVKIMPSKRSIVIVVTYMTLLLRLLHIFNIIDIDIPTSSITIFIITNVLSLLIVPT